MSDEQSAPDGVKSYRMVSRCPHGTGGAWSQSVLTMACRATMSQPSSYIHPKSASSGSDTPASMAPLQYEVPTAAGAAGSSKLSAPAWARVSSDVVSSSTGGSERDTRSRSMTTNSSCSAVSRAKPFVSRGPSPSRARPASTAASALA